MRETEGEEVNTKHYTLLCFHFQYISYYILLKFESFHNWDLFISHRHNVQNKIKCIISTHCIYESAYNIIPICLLLSVIAFILHNGAHLFYIYI